MAMKIAVFWCVTPCSF